jgi:hypothetical protein
MRARFAIKNNWIPTDKWFPVKVLEREKWRTSPQIDDWPGFLTKPYWFRYPDKRAAAVAAHLYDTTLAEHSAASIERWAWQHGLRAQWPKDFPSWWYPGRTQLLVITARPKGGEL